jgi:hypothetical protein
VASIAVEPASVTVDHRPGGARRPGDDRRLLFQSERPSSAGFSAAAVGRRARSLFATFIQQNNPIDRSLWAAITDKHQRVVESLLVHAARREAVRSAAGVTEGGLLVRA